jgi:hypothetical protein
MWKIAQSAFEATFSEPGFSGHGSRFGDAVLVFLLPQAFQHAVSQLPKTPVQEMSAPKKR